MFLTLRALSKSVPDLLLLILFVLFVCACSSNVVGGEMAAEVSATELVPATLLSTQKKTVPAIQEAHTGLELDETQPASSRATATKTPPPKPVVIVTQLVSPEALPSPGDMQAIVRIMALQYALQLAEIPYELKRNPPSYMPYYPGIPEIRELRQQLLAAAPLEKGVYVAQILAYLGVQTQEEVAGETGPEVWVPKWHNYEDNGTRILTCNTYAANAVRALGLECCMSHWFDSEGNPNDHMEGTEYRAENIHNWLNGSKGQEYGWFEVSNLPLEDRLDLLREGYVLYGANRAHNWLVFGIPSGEAQVIPVMTQSIPNTLYGVPASFQFQNPVEGTLFAHKLPDD